MNDLPLTVAKCRVDDIRLEVCQGKIPDVCRLLLWFDPITEFELPDAKASDDDFNNFLGLYRHSSLWFTDVLLEGSQCS